MTDLHDILIAGRMLGGSGGSPAPEPVLITKTITANGTYSATDEGADGYSEVTAAVPELPVTFVKSIKSLGNSIIVTDIVPEYDWETHIDINIGNAISGGTANGYLFCSMSYTDNTNTGAYAIGFNTQNKIQFYLGFNWDDAGSSVYEVAFNSDERGKLSSLVATRANTRARYNYHSTFLGGTTHTRTACTVPIAIGGRNNDLGSPAPYSGAELTFYGIKMFTAAGALIHDLVPAKHKTTNRAGMYDLATNKFYPSSSDFDDFVVEV